MGCRRARLRSAAICTAIAAPSDVKNHEGMAMWSASAAREASASWIAAEASAAVGRLGLFSMMESLA